jgi:hypothetical protein
MKWNIIIVFVIFASISQLTFSQKQGKGSDDLITISGKVMDQNQRPVSGAVLYLDNIKTNCITKKDGSYKLNVSPSALNIEVRSADYEDNETAISGRTTINFTLIGIERNEPSILDSTSVKTTYSKTSNFKGRKMNTYNDIYQMIRGEVSGVVVSGKSVQIQQRHSFLGSGRPLFVLNGAIVSSIDNVNPLEVKSIRVLKGSEASIYGVEGSNGVISITLKNGSEKER